MLHVLFHHTNLCHIFVKRPSLRPRRSPLTSLDSFSIPGKTLIDSCCILGLSDVSDGIDDIADVLGRVKSPLNSLKGALTSERRVFWVCLSIGGLLDTINSLASWLIDPLMDLAMGILKPILDTLGLPSELPGIPGLEKLDEFEQMFAKFGGSMATALNHFTDATGDVLASTNNFNSYDAKLSLLESKFCADYDPSCPSLASN